jgi:hypothetical protein
VPALEYCNDYVTIPDILAGLGTDNVKYTVTDASEGITGSDDCAADSTTPCNMSILSDVGGTWTISTTSLSCPGRWARSPTRQS